MKKTLLCLLLSGLLLSQCKKEYTTAHITGISSEVVKYGGVLSITGKNLDNLYVDSIFLTDSIKTYRLAPLSVTPELIKVEIYNQATPTELLNLSFFYVGIKNTEKIKWFEKKVCIASSWARMSDFPGTGRYKAGIFSVGDKIYVGCGAAGVTFQDFWQFDTRTGSWSQKADLPGVPRIYPISMNGTDCGYMGSGNSADNGSKVQLYDFYKYNPSSDAWTILPDYPDNISNFFVGYFASVQGKPFAGLSNTNPVMRELVNNTWVSRNGIDELMDNTGTAAFSIGNSFYVIAGFNLDGSSSRQVWEYKIADNTWIRRADFPGQTRHVAVCFSIGSYGYYGCGRGWNASTQYKDMWRYDPSNDKWIRMEDFPGGNRSHTVSASDGTNGYAGLGIYMPTTTYLKDFWKYSPE